MGLVKMKFRLFPRDEGFFPLLEKSARIACGCVAQLSEILRSLPATEAAVTALREAEREADDVVREVNRRLERSLVTPFDREDIQLLVTELDNVVDEIFAAADLVLLHRVTQPLNGLTDQLRLLDVITDKNLELIRSLVSLQDIPRLVDEIDRIESDADRIFRRVISELFSGNHSALDILRWKDIVESIEKSIDSVEHASDVVQSIAVKYA
jgi:predicted phosphate transport protein (TIGR00153 family)